MKVVVRKSDALALYTYEDSEVVILEANRLLDSLGADASVNNKLAMVYTNVTNTPTDFVSGKYLFDGKLWIVNHQFHTKEVYAAKLKERNGNLKVTKADKLLNKDA